MENQKLSLSLEDQVLEKALSVRCSKSAARLNIIPLEIF